jgi:hypothetical protein
VKIRGRFLCGDRAQSAKGEEEKNDGCRPLKREK